MIKVLAGGRVLNICSPNTSAYSEYWEGRTVTIYFYFLLSHDHLALPWPRLFLVTSSSCHLSPCHPYHLVILITLSSLSPQHPCHLVTLSLYRPRPCLILTSTSTSTLISTLTSSRLLSLSIPFLGHCIRLSLVPVLDHYLEPCMLLVFFLSSPSSL